MAPLLRIMVYDMMQPASYLVTQADKYQEVDSNKLNYNIQQQ